MRKRVVTGNYVDASQPWHR